MADETVYESTESGSRPAIASYLRRIADALDSGGGVPVDDAESVVVHPPAELDFDVEVEREDGRMGLEFELEWDEAEGTESENEEPVATGDESTPSHGDEDSAGNGTADGTRDPSEEGGTALPSDSDTADGDGSVADDSADVAGADSDATFELYRDNAGEWRWRLRHANGNIIADGGEGYTRKAGAKKGIESVKRNAADALVDEQE